MKLLIKNIEDLIEASRKIVKILDQNSTVLLSGDLGAGKTTLVKHIIDKLGGNRDEVTSPTFNIVQEYFIDMSNFESSSSDNNQENIYKKFKVYHIDLYRLEDSSELDEIGISEILNGNLVFIEWPEMIKDMVNNYIDITIKDGELICRKVNN